MARTWLEQQGYSVADKSMSASYDFEAIKGGAVLKIEVKGTTCDGDDSFFMTKNEIDLHISERGSTGIIVVSGIELRRISKELVAVGGRLFADIGWDIGTWEVTPMAFKVVRRNPARSE